MARKPNNNAEITARKRAEGKSLGGRPAFQIDYEQLEKLCMIFCTEIECAAVLGTSRETLNTRLKEDFRKALQENPEQEPEHRYDGFLSAFKKLSAKGQISLRREQFRMALGDADRKIRPNITMLIWLGKNHLNQTDRIDTTSKGESMVPNSGLDLSKLSDDQFAELGKLIATARELDPAKSEQNNPEKADRNNVH